MASTDLDLTCEFLENELAKLKLVYGHKGIPMKGTVTISPSPTPLGTGEPATPSRKDE